MNKKEERINKLFLYSTTELDERYFNLCHIFIFDTYMYMIF